MQEFLKALIFVGSKLSVLEFLQSKFLENKLKIVIKNQNTYKIQI